MEAMSCLTRTYAPAPADVAAPSLSLQSHQGLRLSHALQVQLLPQQCSNLALTPRRRRSLAVSASATGVAAAPVAVLPVLKFDGAQGGEAELKLKTAKPETAKGLVHRAVITFMQNKRRGTASTLTRAEVRGGGKKPFKQKGTGNARQGSTRTPLRPGGGVVFGPKPKDWSIRMNKKERRLAVGTALQSAAVNMTVIEDVDDSDFPLPKTRDFVAALDRWGVDFKKDNTLFVSKELSKNVQLSSRNIERLKTTTPLGINIYDVLRADKLVITVSGLEALNQRFGGHDEAGDDASDAAEAFLRMVGGTLVLEEDGVEVPLSAVGEGLDVEEGEEQDDEAAMDEGGDVETEDAEGA